MPGGGGDVYLKSHHSGFRARATASSDFAIPSPPKDEAVMGAAAFNPEHGASCGSVKKCFVGGLFALALSLNKQAEDTWVRDGGH